MLVTLALVLAATACNGDGSRSADGIGDVGEEPLDVPAPAADEAMTEAQLLAIAKLPGLYARHRDVAMVCEQDARALTPEQPFPACDVVIVDETGGTRALGLSDVRNVQRLAGDHLLIVRRSLEMVVTDDQGTQLRSLGASFVSPHVTADGLHVLAIAFADELENPGAAPIRTIDRIHAFTGERETLIDDPGAYAPYDVPGSGDVVFVSGRSGLASLWLRKADGSEVQLSNRSTRHVGGKGWAPVPVHALTWMPRNPTAAIYAATIDDHEELWMLDTAAGRVERIGPGRLPARRGDDRLLVIADDKTGPRAVALPKEVVPRPTVEEVPLK